MSKEENEIGVKRLKENFRPADQYSVLLFVSEENKICLSVFSKMSIRGKKDGEFIADLSVKTRSYNSMSELMSDKNRIYFTKR